MSLKEALWDRGSRRVYASFLLCLIGYSVALSLMSYHSRTLNEASYIASIVSFWCFIGAAVVVFFLWD